MASFDDQEEVNDEWDWLDASKKFPNKTGKKNSHNESFEKHEKQLRTYTTLLSMLKAKKPSEAGEPSNRMQLGHQKVLEKLAAVASLLSREREVVCVMPKSLSANPLLRLSASVDKPPNDRPGPSDGIAGAGGEGPVPHPVVEQDFAPRPSLRINKNPDDVTGVSSYTTVPIGTKDR
jgi:hypothetical protein